MNKQTKWDPEKEKETNGHQREEGGEMSEKGKKNIVNKCDNFAWW